MYYYIYDNYLNEAKYSNTLSKIESRLADFGINGKITRISPLKNLKLTLREDLNQGVKTVVVVGNDKTLNQIINLLPDLSLTLGFIPIGPNNNLCNIFGIPEGEEACNIISQRIIEKINLGIINDHYYFISYLEMSGDNIYINCDDDYYISVDKKDSIIIVSNIYYGDYINKIPLINNKNWLNLVIKNVNKKIFSQQKESFSYFKAKKIKIDSDKSIPILLIDEKRIIKNPIKINLAIEKINLIVGKNRNYN
ncbi:MAG: diacylglycerol kinase family protein [Patescibacteria group bacterium]|jgi:diacylglycerol kinase family enzyme